jgi:hypothetical protein
VQCVHGPITQQIVIDWWPPEEYTGAYAYQVPSSISTRGSVKHVRIHQLLYMPRTRISAWVISTNVDVPPVKRSKSTIRSNCNVQSPKLACRGQGRWSPIVWAFNPALGWLVVVPCRLGLCLRGGLHHLSLVGTIQKHSLTSSTN